MNETVPEWVGWAALGALVSAFAWLAWWLLLSPLPVRPAGRDRGRDDADAGSIRFRVALLVLLSGVLFTAGARWDELWHRMYGGFGDDFLWPPHLLIYGGLGLNAAFAGWGLGRALRGRGGVRERFRAEPFLGLLGLMATYQLASIPSDLLWHVIIGPDITAWSLPHVLLAVTTSAILLAGIGLAVSSSDPVGQWLIIARPDQRVLVVAGLSAVALLAQLQIGVTEWEWAEDAGSLAVVATRPAWAFAVVVLAVGIAVAHVALHATRYIGVATFAALVALVGQVATRVIDQASFRSGPAVSAPVLVLVPAVALDAWYFWRIHRRGSPGSNVAGAAVYGVAFALGLWLLDALGLLPLGQPGLSADVVGGCAVAALLIGPALGAVGGWLNLQAVNRQAGAPPISRAGWSRQQDPQTRPTQLTP